MAVGVLWSRRIMDDVSCANADRNWFHTIFSLFNLWFTSRSSKTGISPRQNWYFWGFSRNLKLLEPCFHTVNYWQHSGTFSFCRSNFSSSSKKLCASGLSKLQRPHVCKFTERNHPHPIMMHCGIASSMCPRTQATQLGSIHHVCKFTERNHPPPHHDALWRTI